MAPVSEIAALTFPPGSSFEDASTSEGQKWQNTLSTLQKQEGYQRLYYGRKKESPNEVLLVIDWDSLDAHKQFMGIAEYRPFVTNLVSILEAPPALHHAQLEPFPPTKVASSTSSPVTEFATFTFPKDLDDAGNAAFNDAWKDFVAIFEGAEGWHGQSSGWVIEKLDGAPAFDFLFGWDSVESHMKFRETEQFKSKIGPVREKVAGSSLSHISFTHI